MTTSLLIINCLGCNCGIIDYWLFEHKTCGWWGYCSCIYPSFVYVSLKGIGVVDLDTYTSYTWGIKDFHKCWLGSLAKRRLCLGPAGIINCTPLKKKKKKKKNFWCGPNTPVDILNRTKYPPNTVSCSYDVTETKTQRYIFQNIE